MKLSRHLVLLALALTFCSGTVLAQQKIVIKLGWATSDAPQDNFAMGARAFKSALEETAKGAFDVQLYPNRQIGDEKQLVEGLRIGTVDAAVVTNSVYAQVTPAYLLHDLPFIYADEAQAFKVYNGDVGRKMAAQIEKRGIVMLGGFSSGYRQMLNNKRPVVVPDDVKGVKFRTMQNPVAIEMYTVLGGSPAPMAWSETLTALQQGAMDGMDLPIPLIDSLKVYEAVKFLSLTNHTFSFAGLGMSKRFYDRLTSAQRDAVRKAAVRASADQRKAAAELDAKYLQTLKDKGMVVNVVQNTAAFREKSLPVYEKFRADIGSDLLNAALKQIK